MSTLEARFQEISHSELMKMDGANTIAVRDRLFKLHKEGRLYIAGESPLIKRDSKTDIIEWSEWLVAPVESGYDPANLENFRKGLFPDLKVAIGAPFKQEDNSNLHFGWSAFDDYLGRISRTTTYSLLEEQVPGALQEFRVPGRYDDVIGVDIRRRTMVKVYPSWEFAAVYRDVNLFEHIGDDLARFPFDASPREIDVMRSIRPGTSVNHMRFLLSQAAREDYIELLQGPNSK